MRKWVLFLMLLLITSSTSACSNDVSEKTVASSENERAEMNYWKESPLLEAGSYTMIGEEGRVGFIYDDSEVLRFYPDKIQKYMWRFLGETGEFNGKLKVLAVHDGRGTPGRA